MRASAVRLPATDGAWLDPARRTPGVADAAGRTRRIFRRSELSPSWEVVREIAGAAAATGAKLSPGFPVAELPDGQGFNAATLSYGDLVADGVVDPVKVTLSAVVNATSVARMVLTTESAVVDKPEEDPEPAGGHGHGHGH